MAETWYVFFFFHLSFSCPFLAFYFFLFFSFPFVLLSFLLLPFSAPSLFCSFPFLLLLFSAPSLFFSLFANWIGETKDLLILGTGPTIIPVSPETRKQISDLGIRLEIADTRNAASQFNLLATERGVQQVAAALIPIGWKEGRD
jgi:hypothetical protein